MNKRKNLYELSLFAMFGALMFISKVIMDFLPNIHLAGVFIAVFTLTYRAKALIPIYVYVLLVGLFYGFNPWWIPYTYIWAILWAAIMLIPKKTPKKTAAIISHVLCVVHGLAFGTLWAPAQAILFNLSFPDKNTSMAWTCSGVIEARSDTVLTPSPSIKLRKE